MKPYLVAMVLAVGIAADATAAVAQDADPVVENGVALTVAATGDIMLGTDYVLGVRRDDDDVEYVELRSLSKGM